MPDAPGPGRRCPLHYRYSPATLRRPAELRAEALYVAGGLYGNVPALERLLELHAREPGEARLVFNGDFNWFNRDAASFERINRLVLEHVALRGNVETELARPSDAGCGCGYPAWVADETVARSNEIMDRLRETAAAFPELCRRLGELPMHLVAAVGGLRVAVVNGDAESLAGWSFSHEALSSGADARQLQRWFEAADVDVYACTHTCLPVVWRDRADAHAKWIINNGSCGMPNLRGERYGLITRIATYPTAHASCLALTVKDVYIDLLKVEYDHARWLQAFLHNWPPGSPAHASYFERICNGPRFAGPLRLA